MKRAAMGLLCIRYQVTSERTWPVLIYAGFWFKTDFILFTSFCSLETEDLIKYSRRAFIAANSEL